MSDAPATIALSCREAQLLLRVIDPDKKFNRYTDEETAALRHYGEFRGCPECHDLGLEVITHRPLTHQEAIECWVAAPDHSLLFWTRCDSLRDCLASEHIVGRYKRVPEPRMSDEPEWVSYFQPCSHEACRIVGTFWREAPLCSHYDGDRETTMLLPLTLWVYRKQGWPIDSLLNQQARVLECRLTQLAAHTPDAGYAADEIRANMTALMALAGPDWEQKLHQLVQIH